MTKKTKPLAVPAHAVGDDVWFAWIERGNLVTKSIKVKSVGPERSALEDYPPYQAVRYGKGARGVLFGTGEAFPATRDAAVTALIDSMKKHKDDITDELADIDAQIATAMRGA